MRRPFFRIKVILKNEPRLESEIVMEKAKRLYEYIAEHSDLQKEISNILPYDIISNILNGSLPVFPHEDLGIIVDENELIHYMNHAVLYKEVGDLKLGVMVQNLIDKFEIFKAVYCDMLAGEKLSDWRNVANHEKYSLQADDNVELIFGTEENERKKFFSMQIIWFIAKQIDVLRL